MTFPIRTIYALAALLSTIAAYGFTGGEMPEIEKVEACALAGVTFAILAVAFKETK